jgi:hypothetical protein
MFQHVLHAPFRGLCSHGFAHIDFARVVRHGVEGTIAPIFRSDVSSLSSKYTIVLSFFNLNFLAESLS